MRILMSRYKSNNSKKYQFKYRHKLNLYWIKMVPMIQSICANNYKVNWKNNKRKILHYVVNLKDGKML